MTTPLQMPDSDYQLAAPGEMEAAPTPGGFKIKRLLSNLVKYWWIPVLSLVLCLIGAGIYIYNLPPTYVSKARMWETAKLRLPEGGLFAEDVQNFLGTQTELLESTKMRSLALARLRAATTNIVVPLGKDRKPLQVRVRVVGSSKSSVFTLDATSSDAAYTQAYLNALMSVYLEYKRNIRKEISGGTLASITEQVQSTERDLKAEQEILLQFQRTNNMAILQLEGSVAGGYLATLRTKLSDLQLEDQLLEATLSDKNKISKTNVAEGATASAANGLAGTVNAEGRSTEEILISMPSPELQAAVKEIELLKIQREKLSANLRPKHPKIVKLDDSIERSEKLIEIYKRQNSEQRVADQERSQNIKENLRRQNREQLIASRRTIQLKIESIYSSIKEWEDKVLEANTRLAEAERLKANVQRFQSVHDRLTILLENVSISRNIDQENLAILDVASPAIRTESQEVTTMAGAGIGGLVLGLGIVIFMGIRNDQFISLTEVNEQLGEVIIGQVPAVTGLQPESAVPLLEFNDPRQAYAESFRSLRSALFYMNTQGERPRVVLITSAVPHEGKSTVAANLARILALGGSRVVLVDGDLRRGLLHKLMKTPSEPGLADLLSGEINLEKVIQLNSVENLSFVPRGKIATNSGDLFHGPEFDRILVELRKRFDYVLIDSSPVFAADDASTIAPRVDGTIFVVRSRFSCAGPVREALELLYQRRARILGIIFNHADAVAHSYHYYKYAGYDSPTEEKELKS